MTNKELLGYLRTGRSCSKVRIRSAQLAHVIEAAAKRGETEPMTLVGAVVHDRVQIRLEPSAAFLLTLRGCEFLGAFAVRADSDQPAQWRLQVDEVRFADLVDLRWLPLAQEPRFRRCRFERSVHVSAAGPMAAPAPAADGRTLEQWDRLIRSRDLAFLECRFCGPLDLDLFGEAGEVSFAGSAFEPRSTAKVGFPGGGLQRLTLSNTLLEGRFNVVGVPSTRASADDDKPWELSLYGARLDGVIDLLAAGRFELDLHRAVLTSGGLLLPEGSYQWPQLVPERYVRRTFAGNLRDIMASRSSGNLAASELARLRSRYTDVATQLEVLRDSCQRVPGMDEHEDQSHYRSRMYRLLAELADFPRRALVALVFVVLAFLSLIGTLIACPRDEVCVLLAFVLPAAYAAAACARRASWARALFVVSNAIVLYGMLGYGVRVSRVLVTAGVLIVLFALICGLMSAYYPEHGVLLQADPETTLVANAITGKRYFEGATPPPGATTETSTAEPLPGNPRPWKLGIKIQRAMYFSTVSFTTLGYGDFRPEGRLQVVAAVEVSLGAVLIALLTVVFARRFLRL